jgi:succinoglycan biosynthesis protein ExoW
VASINLSEPIYLRVLTQENRGVAAARNRGLDEADAQTSLIAFLDSDDAWPANHLARAIEALEQGFDFYFTDNDRPGHHESHCRGQHLPETHAFILASGQATGFLDIPRETMAALVLSELPGQVSTVVYRREVHPGLRFNTELKYSGEDTLFFTRLVAAARRICFDLDGLVHCGEGINIYFSNLGWDNPAFMAIIEDQVRCRSLVAEHQELSPYILQQNAIRLRMDRDDFAFHALRRMVKTWGRIPPEVFRLAQTDPSFYRWFPLAALRVVAGYFIGSYKP